MTLEVRPSPGGVEISVLVQPRAPREVVGGVQGSALRVRVHAAPTGGQANEAVRRALARALGRPPRDVEVVSGHRSRRKRVRIAGDPEALSAGLEALSSEPREV